MAPEDMGAKERAQCNPEQLEALECYLMAQQAWRTALEENAKYGEIGHLPKARLNTSDGEVDSIVEDDDDPYEGGVREDQKLKHQKNIKSKKKTKKETKVTTRSGAGAPQKVTSKIKTEVEKYNASLEDILSGMYDIKSIDPAVWEREDVLPVVMLCCGMGGMTMGHMTKQDGKYLATALAIDCDPDALAIHKKNIPQSTCAQLVNEKAG